MLTLCWMTKAARGRVVPHAERDELLLPGGPDQLQEVGAGRPPLVDGHGEGGGPAALDGVGVRHQARWCLAEPGHLGRLPDQAAADPAVVAHPVRLDVERGGPGVDEQGHGVAGHRADLVGVALDVACLLGRGDPPQVTGLGVLGDDGRRGGEQHAVGRPGGRLGGAGRDQGLRRGGRRPGLMVRRADPGSDPVGVGPVRGGARLGHGHRGRGDPSGGGQADETATGESAWRPARFRPDPGHRLFRGCRRGRRAPLPSVVAVFGHGDQEGAGREGATHVGAVQVELCTGPRLSKVTGPP